MIEPLRPDPNQDPVTQVTSIFDRAHRHLRNHILGKSINLRMPNDDELIQDIRSLFISALTGLPLLPVAPRTLSKPIFQQHLTFFNSAPVQDGIVSGEVFTDLTSDPERQIMNAAAQITFGTAMQLNHHGWSRLGDFPRPIRAPKFDSLEEELIQWPGDTSYEEIFTSLIQLDKVLPRALQKPHLLGDQSFLRVTHFCAAAASSPTDLPLPDLPW